MVGEVIGQPLKCSDNRVSERLKCFAGLFSKSNLFIFSKTNAKVFANFAFYELLQISFVKLHSNNMHDYLCMRALALSVLIVSTCESSKLIIQNYRAYCKPYDKPPTSLFTMTLQFWQEFHGMEDGRNL